MCVVIMVAHASASNPVAAVMARNLTSSAVRGTSSSAGLRQHSSRARLGTTWVQNTTVQIIHVIASNG